MSSTPVDMSILLAFEEGKEVGANLTKQERAVILAAQEWRKVGKELAALYEQGEPFPEGWLQAQRRYQELEGELQDAVDALKGEG